MAAAVARPTAAAPMLKIYNSLTRDKQEFVPIEAGKVRMYVCGMTVYDYCHLGHARVMVVFDVVRRWLRASGLNVTYVRNITDIDDKIIKRAHENREPVETLTARFIEAMLYATNPIDAPTLAGVSALLLAVALAACFIPAWRAATVNPMTTLRQE